MRAFVQFFLFNEPARDRHTRLMPTRKTSVGIHNYTRGRYDTYGITNVHVGMVEKLAYQHKIMTTIPFDLSYHYIET